MSKQSLILDFDGVLARTMIPLIDFLQKEFHVSRSRALGLVVKAAMNNPKKPFSARIRHFEGRRFLTFLRSHHLSEQLLTPFFELIVGLDCPKAILTSNYQQLCEFVLGPQQSSFEAIIGLDQVNNKTQGLDLIFQNPLFDRDKTLLVTDTVGDILEFQRQFDNCQILAASWGFHPLPLLQEVLPSSQILQSPEDILRWLDI